MFCQYRPRNHFLSSSCFFLQSKSLFRFIESDIGQLLLSMLFITFHMPFKIWRKKKNKSSFLSYNWIYRHYIFSIYTFCFLWISIIICIWINNNKNMNDHIIIPNKKNNNKANEFFIIYSYYNNIVFVDSPLFFFLFRFLCFGSNQAGKESLFF